MDRLPVLGWPRMFAVEVRGGLGRLNRMPHRVKWNSAGFRLPRMGLSQTLA